MSPKETPKSEPKTLVSRLSRSFSALHMIALLATIAGSVLVYRSFKTYEVPVNVPGVERVEAQREYDITPQFNALNAGNSLNIFLENGQRASVRDYNGNFQLDPEDRVTGLPANIDLNTVLQATRNVLGERDYVPGSF